MDRTRLMDAALVRFGNAVNEIASIADQIKFGLRSAANERDLGTVSSDADILIGEMRSVVIAAVAARRASIYLDDRTEE